ncbi:hypothetical protein LWI29_031953 [Acer saccharum]|uniref:RNase H type-1 domain-containing protein n=1 Tax=Acer saccharum TaxID=4024 RepID=A0AA39W4N6_ACESA|nr:hypothetical protein LWI29_031953 [Acer saccharum]
MPGVKQRSLLTVVVLSLLLLVVFLLQLRATRIYRHWEVPPPGFFKLNVDAAVKPVVSVVTAEARAILEGLAMAVDAGISKLQIESVALEVVNLCIVGM